MESSTLSQSSDCKINEKTASNEDDEIEEEEDLEKKKIVGKHDSGAADLARVTTYEASFFDEDGQNDSSSKEISGAKSIIDKKRSKEDAERVARQKELANVTIKKEDVELIMKEMEISRTDAELKLRQSMGNVVKALITLINE
ncbi:Huntingtin-interacting protein K [Sarcoptes scabiei]|uniref:Huntingtin-interacting protein K n=1 Tax=Sarcoptes scabiei TaxID=52283 RepID=A0A132A4F0_SARSC|nr:Huntingtin-interacting protein K [Sarcoptes scabiei]KPM05833.1 huntingtin-interacting protein K-like protein [Sarcoptes scabiei]UXI14542.1 hypothetical protein NH340_JMT00485 [Sarcoptes scabiei]